MITQRWVSRWLATIDDLMIRSELDARPGGVRCSRCAHAVDVLFVIPACGDRYGMLCPRCQRARNGMLALWRREYFRLISQPFLPCGCRNIGQAPASAGARLAG